MTLQELSDREEIRTLLVTYARLLDSRRLEEYADLFAEEGEWTGSFGTASGRAAILAMMTKAFDGRPNTRENRHYHVISDMIVETDGDRATAWSRWTFNVRGKDDRPVPIMGGHYEDDLVRRNGKWKFLRRLAVSDIPHNDPRDPDFVPDF